MVYPAHQAVDLQSAEILRFLARIAGPDQANCNPFSAKFCAERVEAETGFPTNVEAVGGILKRGLEFEGIGSLDGKFQINLHFGKRHEWWEEELYWATKVKAPAAT